MFSLFRGVGGFPSTAMALALGIWGLSGGSAMAQGPGLGVPSGYYGAPSVGYAPPSGSFGPGYPGYGLEYTHGCALRFYHRHYAREVAGQNWFRSITGKECFPPAFGDPYSDPAALGFWPPYSAPAANAAY